MIYELCHPSEKLLESRTSQFINYCQNDKGENMLYKINNSNDIIAWFRQDPKPYCYYYIMISP